MCVLEKNPGSTDIFSITRRSPAKDGGVCVKGSGEGGKEGSMITVGEHWLSVRPTDRH